LYDWGQYGRPPLAFSWASCLLFPYCFSNFLIPPLCFLMPAWAFLQSTCDLQDSLLTMLLSCRCEAYEHKLWVVQGAGSSGHTVEVHSMSRAESMRLLLHEWQARHQPSVFTIWLTVQHPVWVIVSTLSAVLGAVPVHIHS